MPCDSIREYEMDLGKLNRELMASVLQDIGVDRSRINDYIRTGVLRTRQQYSETELKKKYAVKIIQKAKDFGWSVKQEADGSYSLLKASF